LEVASQILDQLEHPEKIVVQAGQSKQAIEHALLNGMTKPARINALRCDVQRAFKALKSVALKDSAKPWMMSLKAD
jgi:hypothetical protein